MLSTQIRFSFPPRWHSNVLYHEVIHTHTFIASKQIRVMEMLLDCIEKHKHQWKNRKCVPQRGRKIQVFSLSRGCKSIQRCVYQEAAGG